MREEYGVQDEKMTWAELAKDEQKILLWWKRLDEEDQKLIRMLMELLLRPKKSSD